ncbi:MAG: hypothetical protein DI628_08690 [Blastochloris viridis]|uniref:Uncharacterized protein n=1 Tax=Blastochloris viridis TaxID=1079 RepID=A0A6N4RCH5_BLAVI|nr:MAG: hypothetical protein DI628_08690 [Blastochloris viridis]
MALRRKLPSRMTTDTPSESEATPKVSAPKPATPAPAPVESPAPQEPVTAAAPTYDPFAAAAAEAFGTVEAAPKPRVLEDSFSVPAANAEHIAEPVAVQPVAEPATEAFTAPAWQQPAESFSAPAWDAPVDVTTPEPAYSAPAWDAPAAVEVEVAAPAVIEIHPEAQPVIQPEPVFSAPAWDQPVVVTPADTVAEPMAEGPANTWEAEAPAALIVTDFLPHEETVAAPETTVSSFPEIATDLPQAVGIAAVAESEAEASTDAAGETAQGPTNFSFEPSRPDNSRIKRRIREKRARDFSAMGASEDARPRNHAVTDAFAPTVPVDTRPIDQVDDALIESGVIAPRPGDSLTSHLPTGVAESTQRFEPEPQSAPFMASPQPEPIVEPVAEPVVEVAPVSLPEPVREPAPQPQTAPELPPEPQPLPQPSVPEFVPAATMLPPESEIRTPSFNLSNTAASPSAEALPAPQSDLPWVQSQPAAEWDIGGTAANDWGQHAPETASEPAVHMPPQADLYKPMTGRPASVPPQIPGGIPTPSASASLTPELPGQRRKAQGTPWALVAVGAVVVLAAGGYMLTSGKKGASAQLASITNRTATGNEQQPLLPPPDGTGATGSFMAASPSPATDPSGSAMVSFADVSPDEANQPIVADGNEEMPKGFIAQFQSEVEKARNLKDSGAAVAEVPSGITSATAPAAAAGTGYTQDELKKELEAYRTALASSANPAELKPGSFDASRTGGQTDAEMASGSLLPPPAALPPAELYTNNPKNLPVVAEPVTNAPERVRTLADFPDVDAYMPEREKVEIPANLKPKLAATDFPALEVLSYVPNQGVVAFADGREGVLLIGESINGWELVAVNADTAEFKAGQKSYQVTSQN